MSWNEKKVQKLVGNAYEVIDEGDGVRIKRYFDAQTDEVLSPIPVIVKAALALQLDPEQFIDESQYADNRRMGSSWTGEYGSIDITINVKFLYEVPK